MAALALAMLSVAAAPCCVWAGHAFARHRFRGPVHQHAYGMWEDCKVEEFGRLVPGQKRDCLGCGVREIRTVTTDEVV